MNYQIFVKNYFVKHSKSKKKPQLKLKNAAAEWQKSKNMKGGGKKNDLVLVKTNNPDKYFLYNINGTKVNKTGTYLFKIPKKKVGETLDVNVHVKSDGIRLSRPKTDSHDYYYKYIIGTDDEIKLRLMNLKKINEEENFKKLVEQFQKGQQSKALEQSKELTPHEKQLLEQLQRDLKLEKGPPNLLKTQQQHQLQQARQQAKKIALKKTQRQLQKHSKDRERTLSESQKSEKQAHQRAKKLAKVVGSYSYSPISPRPPTSPPPKQTYRITRHKPPNKLMCRCDRKSKTQTIPCKCKRVKRKSDIEF